MINQLYKCTHKQTGEVRVLHERRLDDLGAFDLDTRLWALEEYDNRYLTGMLDDEWTPPEVKPITERFDVLVQSVKCWHCEAYHVGNPHECRRSVHEKFV